MAADPTLDEMLATLDASPFASEFDAFDRAEAIYWFAHNYYGDQGTNLYSVLSTSDFSPGPIARGPSESAAILYDELVAAYFPGDMTADAEESV